METIPIIFDIGSSSCKIGFSRDQNPKKFLSIVGKVSKSLTKDMQFQGNDKKVAIGGEVKAGFHDLNYPIKNGDIKSWEDLQTLFEHGFHQLLGKEELQNQSIVLTDSIHCLPNSRKRLAEMMFETFNASYFYIDHQPFFSLFSKPEKSAGIVIEIGDGLTQILPCIGGYPLRKGMMKFPFAGEVITNSLLQEFSNTEIGNKSHLKDLATVKENYCRVALNYESELKNLKPLRFELKNTQFTIGEGQISAPERLFRPGMLYEKGIHEMLNDSILSCDEEYQAYLYQNIIISGGTASFPGFAERLSKEMRMIAPDQTIRVCALHNPSESAWRGAAKFTRFPKAFHKRFAISRQEYNEDKNIVDQKCFTFNSV